MQDPAELNPYRSPNQVDEHLTPVADLGEPIGKLDAVLHGKNQPWTVSIFADRLRFSGSDVPDYDVMRDELPQLTTLHNSFVLRRLLEVRKTKKRILQFTPEGFGILKEWIGPPTSLDLKFVLKRHFRTGIAMAILFMVLSLPMGGDPADGIEPSPFDMIFFLLGLSLLAIVVVSRLVPHRALFLVEALWFAALAIWVAYSVVVDLDWPWAIVVVLQIYLMAGRIREYRRFSEMQPGI
jgi:hypothetical protein